MKLPSSSPRAPDGRCDWRRPKLRSPGLFAARHFLANVIPKYKIKQHTRRPIWFKAIRGYWRGEIDGSSGTGRENICTVPSRREYIYIYVASRPIEKQNTYRPIPSRREKYVSVPSCSVEKKNIYRPVPSRHEIKKPFDFTVPSRREFSHPLSRPVSSRQIRFASFYRPVSIFFPPSMSKQSRPVPSRIRVTS